MPTNLPSNRDVLNLLQNKGYESRLNVKQRAKLVYDQIIVSWQDAKIPTASRQSCVRKIENLYESYRVSQKSSSRASNVLKEIEFEEKLTVYLIFHVKREKVIM